MSTTDINNLLYRDLSDFTIFFYCSAIVETIFLLVPLTLIITTLYRVFHLNEDLSSKKSLRYYLEIIPPIYNKGFYKWQLAQIEEDKQK